MADPIVESISAALATLIEGVTIAGGYQQDLAVVRPKRLHLEGDVNRDNLVIIAQADARLDVDATTAFAWIQTFALQALVVESDDATDPIDTRLNKIAADIIKHIFTGDNALLGGLADGIRLADPATEKIIWDPNTVGISVNVDVFFETAVDPYSQP
jgi:hypothetical protein